MWKKLQPESRHLEPLDICGISEASEFSTGRGTSRDSCGAGLTKNGVFWLFTRSSKFFMTNKSRFRWSIIQQLLCQSQLDFEINEEKLKNLITYKYHMVKNCCSVVFCFGYAVCRVWNKVCNLFLILCVINCHNVEKNYALHEVGRR